MIASYSEQIFDADALDLADQRAKELFAAGQREEATHLFYEGKAVWQIPISPRTGSTTR